MKQRNSPAVFIDQIERNGDWPAPFGAGQLFFQEIICFEIVVGLSTIQCSGSAVGAIIGNNNSSNVNNYYYLDSCCKTGSGTSAALAKFISEVPALAPPHRQL